MSRCWPLPSCIQMLPPNPAKPKCGEANGTEQGGMGRSEARRRGGERSGAEGQGGARRSGVERSGVEPSGAERSGFRSGAERSRAERSGAESTSAHEARWGVTGAQHGCPCYAGCVGQSHHQSFRKAIQCVSKCCPICIQYVESSIQCNTLGVAKSKPERPISATAFRFYNTKSVSCVSPCSRSRTGGWRRMSFRILPGPPPRARWLVGSWVGRQAEGLLVDCSELCSVCRRFGLIVRNFARYVGGSD